MAASPSSSITKAIFDRAVAAAALVVIGPIIAATAVGVRLTMGAPVLFCQVRPGLRAKPFKLWKFRTMIDATDDRGRLLPDEARLTEFGKFLRSTSLDELPQLWNVLRGEMSLVGPRPLLMQYVSRYSATQRRRLDARPGITGWAQVKGRNSLSWPEKFELDVWYVDNWSLGLDLKILALTVLQVLRRDGISRAGHATMPEFMGDSSAIGNS